MDFCADDVALPAEYVLANAMFCFSKRVREWAHWVRFHDVFENSLVVLRYYRAHHCPIVRAPVRDEECFPCHWRLSGSKYGSRRTLPL